MLKQTDISFYIFRRITYKLGNDIIAFVCYSFRHRLFVMDVRTMLRIPSGSFFEPLLSSVISHPLCCANATTSVLIVPVPPINNAFIKVGIKIFGTKILILPLTTNVVYKLLILVPILLFCKYDIDKIFLKVLSLPMIKL